MKPITITSALVYAAAVLSGQHAETSRIYPDPDPHRRAIERLYDTVQAADSGRLDDEADQMSPRDFLPRVKRAANARHAYLEAVRAYQEQNAKDAGAMFVPLGGGTKSLGDETTIEEQAAGLDDLLNQLTLDMAKAKPGLERDKLSDEREQILQLKARVAELQKLAKADDDDRISIDRHNSALQKLSLGLVDFWHEQVTKTEREEAAWALLYRGLEERNRKHFEQAPAKSGQTGPTGRSIKEDRQ